MEDAPTKRVPVVRPVIRPWPGSHHSCQGLWQTVLRSYVGLGSFCCDDSSILGNTFPAVVVQQVKVRGYCPEEGLIQKVSCSSVLLARKKGLAGLLKTVKVANILVSAHLK